MRKAQAGSQGRLRRGPHATQPSGAAHFERTQVVPRRVAATARAAARERRRRGQSRSARAARATANIARTRSTPKDGQKSSTPPFGDSQTAPKKLSCVVSQGTKERGAR